MAGFVVAGILVLVFGLASMPAKAGLSLGVMGGYYSPNFGKVNEHFNDHWNNLWGSGFEFKAATMYGLALGYDLGHRFRLRLEYDSFESKTSDTWYNSGWIWANFWEYYHDDDWKLTVTPVIFSGTYKFSPFYIGAGVGWFSTKVQWTFEYDAYRNGSWNYSYFWSDSDSDSPTGWCSWRDSTLGINQFS